MVDKVSVFISYTHDSEGHRQWVLDLANRLIDDGIDCWCDRYIENSSPAEGWPAWMDNMVSSSDYVLVVCTENYLDRFEGREKVNVGLGAKFESLLIKADIYHGDSVNKKFIPVIANKEDQEFIPRILKSNTRYLLIDDEGYDNLYRRLTDQPYVIRPTPGPIKIKPIKSSKSARQIEPIVQTHEFNLKGLKADYILLDGTGQEVYKKKNVRCQLDNRELVLPEDLNTIRAEIEHTQHQAKEAGESYFWNGKLLGLKSFKRSRSDEKEELVLNLKFHPTDYYTFLATSMSLDKNVLNEQGEAVTVRQKYLHNVLWDDVVPCLATGFGVAIAIITKDNYLVVAKRGRTGVGPWQEYFNTSINEGVSLEFDLDATGAPDLFYTAKRGALEELNLNIKTSNISFLTFGYDTIQYQWGLHGMAEIDLTSEEVMQANTTGAKDKWEVGTLHYIKFELKDVIQFIIQNEPWTPFGKVCIICVLIYHFGREAVEKEIAGQLNYQTF